LFVGARERFYVKSSLMMADAGATVNALDRVLSVATGSRVSLWRERNTKREKQPPRVPNRGFPGPAVHTCLVKISRSNTDTVFVADGRIERSVRRKLFRKQRLWRQPLLQLTNQTYLRSIFRDPHPRLLPEALRRQSEVKTWLGQALEGFKKNNNKKKTLQQSASSSPRRKMSSWSRVALKNNGQ